MYAGVSGMKGMQTKLDVIGNNIANVNTTGYKKGRVTFQDMISQTVSPAQGPAGNLGGMNPSQVGLGAQLGTVDNIHTQGNNQTTNRPLDISIEGDGMFAVQEGTETFYTRAGNFYLDQAGDIVTGSGQYLLDTAGDTINIPANAESFSVQTNGQVQVVLPAGASSVGTIGIAQFSNPAGLEKVGSNMYRHTDNADADNGNDLLGAPSTNGRGSLVSGSLEMSNVDLSEEFTEMITAQRGFQANTRIITTSDEILQELVNLKR